MKRTARLVALLVVLSVAGVFAADWPQYFGPRRDSTSTEKGLLRTWPKEGPKVLWTVPLGAGFGGPAVSRGKSLPARPRREGRGHPQGVRLRDRQGAVELRLRRARHVSSSQARARLPRWTATSSTSLVRSATCTRSTSTRTSRCGARTSGRTSGAAPRSSFFPGGACRGAECRRRRVGLRRGAPPAGQAGPPAGRQAGPPAGAGRPSCSAPGRAGRNASGGTRRAARCFGFAFWSGWFRRRLHDVSPVGHHPEPTRLPAAW